jgi:uncharacterized protein YjbI with pentapeptide repeats
MKIEIKNRFTNNIILCGEYESTKDALEKNRGANLSGAYLSGAKYEDFKINKAPVLIDTQVYQVIIFDNHMKIGCKLHTHEQWAKLTLLGAKKMDGEKAQKFWKEWKKPLLSICDIQRKG